MSVVDEAGHKAEEVTGNVGQAGDSVEDPLSGIGTTPGSD
jgi:hypothetical protein